MQSCHVSQAIWVKLLHRVSCFLEEARNMQSLQKQTLNCPVVSLPLLKKTFKVLFFQLKVKSASQSYDKKTVIHQPIRDLG